MKKLIAVLTATVLTLGASACSTDGSATVARIEQQMNDQGGPN
jgi:hypothetical protein